MKLQILSDLHLEFSPFLVPPSDADVVVLAGDIHVGRRGVQWAMDWSRKAQKPVIYVTGNHEYYGSALPHLDKTLRALAEGSHVHLLQSRAVVLDGVRFLGCTLWSDFALGGDAMREKCMYTAEWNMNDYRRIRHSPAYRRLTPGATRAQHVASVAWLRDQLRTPYPGPTVVVTHHAPSARSLPEPGAASNPLNAAYASNLDELLDGAAVLWVHGHTHHVSDYQVNGTRVVCNPRGYADGSVPGFNAAFVVEVPSSPGASTGAGRRGSKERGQ